jgi:quercetin dioxygenase-like cupin family protein
MADPFIFIQSLDALTPAIPPDTTVSRTLVNQPQVHIIVFGFAPGQELSEHTSARTAILHFVRGTARLTLGGTEQEAGPGTIVHMEPHLPHSVFAETETVMLLTMLGA